MEIGGTFPMLYAFFDDADLLRRDAFTRQINAAIASGAAGIAVLGLATEVSKLGQAERRQIVEWVAADIAGRLPLAVTIADGNCPDMIESARFARRCGAAWLILQPPRPPATANDLIEFFGTVADSVDCPIAIQNAPEFLGLALSASELNHLTHRHPNVTIVKAESSAVAVARLIETVGTRLRVFNGRAGLELVDNFRAGVHGMIPGIETIDFQVGIEKAMRLGDPQKAEALYGSILPTLSFIMQGLPHFVLYGKLIAALRLGLAPSHSRRPAEEPTAFGVAAAHRFADALGPLPH
jgi:2-keto-3-deoxy-L-arabinonate dehydratase